MNRKQINNWKKIRNKGKLNYIIMHGVLQWGLLIFIIMTLINQPFSNGFSSQSAITHYIICLVAGIIFGMVTWFILERNYIKATNKNDKEK